MSFLLLKSFTGFFSCQHPLGSLFFATQLLFMSYALVDTPNLEKPRKVALITTMTIDKASTLTLPYRDTSNFDNSQDSVFMSKVIYKDLALESVFPYYVNRETTKLVLHGKIIFSDSVQGIIVKNYMGDHEMESRLITYHRGTYKGSRLIAYDEIAESAFRTEALIEDSILTITSYNYMEEPAKVTKTVDVIKADGSIEEK